MSTKNSSSDIAIRVQGIAKCYQIYNRPGDRLKQFIVPRLKRLLGKKPAAYFNEFWALKDISFEVKRGETLGIIGRNGSGKSTLLQIICGTLSPTSGSVQTNGRVAALLELGSGFNPEFTGRENVYLNAAVLGLTKAEVDARFDDIVVFADIGQFIEQPVKSYSSGMMLRLAFAVIAHVDADILIVDEALAVGDAFFTQKCMRFLREFMVNGTILFVSHDTASVKSLCNTAIWLDKGRLLEIGTPKDVSEMYLQAFYDEQQGASKKIKLKPNLTQNTDKIEIAIDQRQNFINASNLRNDLQIFKFNPDNNSFGKAGAQICDVKLLDEKDNPFNWVVGGELVTLRISVQAHEFLEAPVVGFLVKDRLGQILFGDNTFLAFEGSAINCPANGELVADFTFNMPLLPKGDYSIGVAIANGSQDEHEQHHWIHDALMFKSESSSVATGLIGIPMLNVKLNTRTPA
jgi:lipopolysaccharide transport system ATP-binding protein